MVLKIEARAAQNHVSEPIGLVAMDMVANSDPLIVIGSLAANSKTLITHDTRSRLNPYIAHVFSKTHDFI